MTAPQTEPLRRLLQGLQGLWGDKHGFALCCLEIVSTPVPDRAEAWAAIAPGGIGAGDGWYECADHVKPDRKSVV